MGFTAINVTSRIVCHNSLSLREPRLTNAVQTSGPRPDPSKEFPSDMGGLNVTTPNLKLPKRPAEDDGNQPPVSKKAKTKLIKTTTAKPTAPSLSPAPPRRRLTRPRNKACYVVKNVFQEMFSSTKRRGQIIGSKTCLKTAHNSDLGRVEGLPSHNKSLFPPYPLPACVDFKIPNYIFVSPPQESPLTDGSETITQNIFSDDCSRYWGNRYPHFGSESKCACTLEDECGRSCQNRSMNYECTETNCNVGEKGCSNRAFAGIETRLARGGPYDIGVSVIRTENRGLGILSNRRFKPGEPVMEYNGEIITNRERQRRMGGSAYKNNKNFYIMSYGEDVFIDATIKGSNARFVNHSCKPNCKMVRWVVSGQPRMALVAGDEPIPAGKELTYDYNFHSFEAVAQECLCGEENCRGTLGPKPKPMEAIPNTTDNALSTSCPKPLQLSSSTVAMESSKDATAKTQGRNPHQKSCREEARDAGQPLHHGSGRVRGATPEQVENHDNVPCSICERREPPERPEQEQESPEIGWVQCAKCDIWQHCRCAGVAESLPSDYDHSCATCPRILLGKWKGVQCGHNHRVYATIDMADKLRCYTTKGPECDKSHPVRYKDVEFYTQFKSLSPAQIKKSYVGQQLQHARETGKHDVPQGLAGVSTPQEPLVRPEPTHIFSVDTSRGDNVVWKPPGEFYEASFKDLLDTIPEEGIIRGVAFTLSFAQTLGVFKHNDVYTEDDFQCLKHRFSSIVKDTSADGNSKILYAEIRMTPLR